MDFECTEEWMIEQIKSMGYLEVMRANQLANYLYQLQGYKNMGDYDFATASHPQGRLMFQMAVVSLWYCKEEE